MNIAKQLTSELDRIAVDWEWLCVEKPKTSPVRISPIKIEVSAVNKQSGAKTIPIEVSFLNSAHISETARFVCQILMIETPGGARAKALLVDR